MSNSKNKVCAGILAAVIISIIFVTNTGFTKQAQGMSMNMNMSSSSSSSSSSSMRMNMSIQGRWEY
jgi:hypothetical protein